MTIFHFDGYGRKSNFQRNHQKGHDTSQFQLENFSPTLFRGSRDICGKTCRDLFFPRIVTFQNYGSCARERPDVGTVAGPKSGKG